MLRQRLVRLLLPVALVALVGTVVWLATRHRPPAAPASAPSGGASGPRIEGFAFTDLVAGRRRLAVKARSGVFQADGGFKIVGVERAEVDREGGGPLVLRADRGAGSGAQGKRVVRLDGGVQMIDPDQGFRLDLPSVEIDQATDEVRSLGTVALGGDRFTGTAASVVYGLSSQPTTIRVLALRAPSGATLRADAAVLRAGSREIDLEGQPSCSQGDMALSADRISLFRRADGRLERASLAGHVVATSTPASGPHGDLRSGSAEVGWDPAGDVASVVLEDGVGLVHGENTLNASRITITHPAASPEHWALHAEGDVRWSGKAGRQERGTLRADILDATVDGAGTVLFGEARGGARFQAAQASGEAPWLRFVQEPAPGTVSLLAVGRSRARVASGRTRIVAERIDSDSRGVQLSARGRVEATLLPEPKGDRGGDVGLFRTDAAVHFLSETLDSVSSGERLTFQGEVRGWQGDRNLSADRVEIDKTGNGLHAEGRVATRSPRRPGKAVAEQDLLRVSADALDYGGEPARAVYSGRVRVSQAEGDLDSDRIEVRFAEGGGAERFEASGAVRFTYVPPKETAGAEKGSGKAAPTTGKGDRAVYDTAGRIIRLFGDSAPAEIRRSGPDGGLTTGRVLRYHLDTGSLEVESGDATRADEPGTPR